MDKEIKKDNKKNIRRRIVIIIAIIATIISYISIRGSYLETKEIGDDFLSAFWQKTVYTLILLIVNFVFLFFSFYLTNKTMRKGLKIIFDDEKKEMPRFPNKSVSFVIALIGSVLTTNIFLNKVLLGFSNSKFGIKDPVFNLDISFFVFLKPLIKITLIYLIVVDVATLVYAILYSIIIINKNFNGIERESISKVNLANRIKSRVIMLAILAGLFVIFNVVLNIGNENFMKIDLTDGNFISVMGAGKADSTLKLWGYVLLAVLTTYSIIKAYKAYIDKSIRRVVGNILIVPIYLIVFAAVLALYQAIFIGNDELSSNEKYIKDNIDYTKQAYGINVDEKKIEYSETIDKNDINENSNLLANVAIVNEKNVLQELENSQTSKGYYSYRKTQIEQYNINNAPTLLYVTPREISNSKSTYSSKTYQYTHGYGTIFTLAGKTDDDGYLINYDKNISQNSEKDEILSINQKQIYYGLETNNSVVINSKTDEVDYIDESTNEEVLKDYEGNAGLNLNFLDRLILAIKERDAKLAFSGSVTSDSKILTNRNIINRAKSVLPYLKYDSSPYLVIDDDTKKLYWVLDAYTISNYYPFSQKSYFNNIEEINYIRNSIKVIINAYDGTMKFYITDRNDPIAMAYNNIYKGLFAASDETIPTGISNHFVYPKTLFNIQSKIVEDYHDIKPEVLYRGNDIWQISETGVSEKEEQTESYYTMVKNSNNNDTLGLVIPYSTYNKQNLTAYLVGTYENGKATLTISRITSKNSTVLGMVQIETQINQDENIAKEIASLSTTGTKITRNLLAIPINNTILYVEPIYQQLINEVTQRPTLKRVIVASGNKIAIGNDLNEALDNLLSQYATNIEVYSADSKQDLINEIIKSNENLKNSSSSNDWKLFGQDMDKLTGLIDELKALVEQENKEKSNSTNKNETTSNEIANEVSENML